MPLVGVFFDFVLFASDQALTMLVQTVSFYRGKAQIFLIVCYIFCEFLWIVESVKYFMNGKTCSDSCPHIVKICTKDDNEHCSKMCESICGSLVQAQTQISNLSQYTPEYLCQDFPAPEDFVKEGKNATFPKLWNDRDKTRGFLFGYVFRFINIMV